MFGGMAHHLFADTLASGEKDIVKMLLQQAGIFFASAGDNCHIVRGKTFAQHFLNELAGVGRISTWLDDCRISGGNGIHQRVNGQKKRIVPRTHNEDDTVRRRLLKTSGMKLCQRSPDRLFSRKFSHML